MPLERVYVHPEGVDGQPRFTEVCRYPPKWTTRATPPRSSASNPTGNPFVPAVFPVDSESEEELEDRRGVGVMSADGQQVPWSYLRYPDETPGHDPVSANDGSLSFSMFGLVDPRHEAADSVGKYLSDFERKNNRHLDNFAQHQLSTA